MTSDELGWVVIERNQASGVPEVLEGCSIGTEEYAAELAAAERAENRKRGRREHYSIARIVEETDI